MAEENLLARSRLGGVPLADASVTEWRFVNFKKRVHGVFVPLADASVTEWRKTKRHFQIWKCPCHSLMLVLLNGGEIYSLPNTSPRATR